MAANLNQKLSNFFGMSFQEKLFQLSLKCGVANPHATAFSTFVAQRLRLCDVVRRRLAAQRLPTANFALSKEDGYLRIPATQVAADTALRTIRDHALAYAEKRFPSDTEYDRFIEATPGAAPMYNIVGFNQKERSFSIADLDSFEPLYQVLVQPTVLKIAADYLGALPTIESVGIYYTKSNNTVLGSQRFHNHTGIDYSKPGEVGLFMNLSDVTVENGPFTCVNARQSAPIVTNRSLYSGSKVTDEIVAAQIDPGDIHSLVGPLGETLFCDGKRCLHYGGRASSGSRLILIAFYSLPQNGRVSRSSIREMTNRSALAKTALDRIILDL